MVALGALNTWHILLISRGETSIEVHINRKERSKAAKLGLVRYVKMLMRCLFMKLFFYYEYLLVMMSDGRYLMHASQLILFATHLILSAWLCSFLFDWRQLLKVCMMM